MPNKLKLLVVNASLEQSETLKNALISLDVFDVTVKHTSLDAIKLLKDTKVNVIITDIDVGEIDGWRFSRLVRSGMLKTPKNTPIVMTPPTYCERIAETTARAYGIDAILPLSQTTQLPQILANVLSSHIEKSSRLKLLLIEQNDTAVSEIKQHLEYGFAITNVATSDKAVQLVRQMPFSIILLNATQSTISDITDFVHQVKRANPNQAIVTLIDSEDADFAEQLLLLGVTDFIRLPYSHNLLNKVCEQAARREDFMVSYAEFADKVEQLSQSHTRYKDLFSAHQRILVHLNTVVMELDVNNNICFINPAWEELSGSGLQASLGLPLTSFFDGSEREKLGNALHKIKNKPGSNAKIELQLQHARGHTLWVECKFQRMESAQKASHITLSIDNIDERKQAEFSLQHLAQHDSLTSLHNRYYFDQQLQQLCSEVLATEKHVLIYIDLDHFKVINDSQGHQQGDTVLKQVANIFQSSVIDNSLVCRLGGDEFAIIIENTDILDAHMIAEHLCQQIEEHKFKFAQQEYSISCSIGITQINSNNNDASECLKQADIALYVAKNRGRNLVHCYSKEDAESKHLLTGITWAHRVRNALKHNQVEIHFQPIWCYRRNRIAYCEALVRLNIDDELIYPNQFIPALELVTDIHLLDHCVIRKTIKTLAEYPEIEKVAINLSAQALNDENILLLVSDTLKQHHVSPSRVTFEITESASISNLVATTAMIDKLQELGCDFSIDDFGTGFSTFSYLKQLPANQVKIDGSFVKDMTKDPIDEALVAAIKDISHSLNKTCVAEYVEDKQTFDLLAKIGVDYAQGYYISKPIPAHLVCNQIKKINADNSTS